MDGPLSGKSFVVTGRLQRSTRTQIEARIKSLGGTVLDSVTKKTSYLVVGEDAGSKLARAQKLKTRILDEDMFDRLAAGETLPEPEPDPSRRSRRRRSAPKKSKADADRRRGGRRSRSADDISAEEMTLPALPIPGA